MKRTLCLLTLAAAMLVCPALAQENQHCYGIGTYTEDSSYSRHYDTTVCEFSDGRANVSTLVGEDYQSDWYTPEQWQKAKPGILAAADRAVANLNARNEAAGKVIRENAKKERAQIYADSREGDAHKFRSKKECEKVRDNFRCPGQKISFVWTGGACHYNASDALLLSDLGCKP